MKQIRLTRAGLIYSIFSVTLLIIGLSGGELLTSVCGAGLCAYFLQSFLSLTLSFVLWKNAEYRAELKNGKIIVEPIYDKDRKRPPLLIFGITSFYVFYFITDEKNKKCKNISIKIRLKKTTTVFEIPEYKRGLFFQKSEYVELNDIAGFFSIKFFKNKKSINRIIIPPKITEKSEFVLPQTLAESATAHLNIRRTDELYESRPYIPGDDTRKINWKLYAHTEELAVNRGDFIPPPHNFFTIYIFEPILQKYSPLAEKKFDEFINKAASIAVCFHKNKVNLDFLFYNHKTEQFELETVLGNDKNGEEKIKTSLSYPQIRILKQTGHKQVTVHTAPNPFICDIIDIKKRQLLYFIMPYDNYKADDYSSDFVEYKDNVYFYFGPTGKTINWNNILYRFLFDTKTLKTESKYTKSLNECIIKEKNIISRGGFHAYQI